MTSTREQTCGSCGYPLDWNGEAEMARCPECGSTHTKKWLTRQAADTVARQPIKPGRVMVAFVVPGITSLVGGSLSVFSGDGIRFLAGGCLCASPLFAIVLFLWL